MLRRTSLFPALGALLASTIAGAQDDNWRTLRFRASEVTAPDVSVSPDGTWLVFTMLGKLFRVPTRGGAAEQLTFGPYYDDDPAVSPDGSRIAFGSDRDGSSGNIHVLTLATGAIARVSNETWAERPAWALDGQSIAYLRLNIDQWNSRDSAARPPATIRRVKLGAGDAESIHTPRDIARSVFFLPDGRLGWTTGTRDTVTRQWSTRIEVADSPGRITTLRVLDGVADPVVPARNGFYARYRPDTDLTFIPLGSQPERRLMPVSGERSFFAVSMDGTRLFVGNLGRLWNVATSGTRISAIPFTAEVAFAARVITPPPRWTPVLPGTTSSVRAVRQPRLSPDRSRLLFVLNGKLWQQRRNGSTPAEQVVTGEGAISEPSFSPTGTEVAYFRSAEHTSIDVFDFRSGSQRTVGSRTDCGYEYLSWSPSGLLVVALGDGCNHRIISIDPVTGAERVLSEATTFEPRPQLSADGRTLFFQAQFPGTLPAFYSKRVEPAATPRTLLRANGDGSNIIVAGPWAVRATPNGMGISLENLDSPQTGSRVIPDVEGVDFDVSADGSILVYSIGANIYLHPTRAGGRREEIAVRTTLRAPTPPPTLITRVRLLDFSTNTFGAETSLLIEDGRIRRVGSDTSSTPGTVRLNGGGRLAIPGLFEMHAHFEGCGGSNRILAGVTSARNMGGYLSAQTEHAARSDYTSDTIPRCFFAGRIFEGPTGRNEDHFFVHLTQEEEGRHHVRLWKQQGAQFIKVYNRLAWPVQRAMADEARQLGLPLQAHGTTLEQIVKGITLGYAGLTHWYGQSYDDVLELIAKAGVRWEPTLGAGGGFELGFREQPERFSRAERGDRRISDQNLRGRWAHAIRSLKAAYDRGIIFHPGTDRGPAGLALHYEMQLYALAGIPPIDILRFATLRAAETVGAEAHLGSLEVGKLADLVLLDADPLQDIANAQKVWRVFKGGWVYAPR